MSAFDFFAAARKYKRELTGEPLAGLTQHDVDVLNAATVARWAAQKPATAPKPPPGLPTAMSDPAAFYGRLRASFGSLSQSQVDGINALLIATGRASWPLSWVAYALATAWHETGQKMQPNVENLNYSVEGLLKTFGRHRISEADARKYGRAPGRPANQEAIGNTIYGGEWGKENLGNTQPGDGFKYRGRGLDHCTGRANYTKVDAALGLGGKLIANPDLLLIGDEAGRALVTGMESGRYTTKKLADYLPKGEAGHRQFMDARRIINVQDKAALIADHALKFQSALKAGGWA